MTVRHLTQTDLAQRWQISPRTLERWRWLGEGPVYLKVGGRVLYRIEDVEAFEATQLRERTDVPATGPVEQEPSSPPEKKRTSPRRHAGTRGRARKDANTSQNKK